MTQLYLVEKIVELEYSLSKLEAGFLEKRKRELKELDYEDNKRYLIELLNSIETETEIRDYFGKRSTLTYKREYHKKRKQRPPRY